MRTHLTQEICEKLAPVIAKKIDMAAKQKMKLKWKFSGDD